MLDSLRDALRGFRHRRGVASTIVLTLTLGIGANSAIFSVVAAVFLRQLPYPAPERVEAMRVSPRFFGVFGVSAAIGRTLTPQEELFGGPRAIVLSDAYWR